MAPVAPISSRGVFVGYNRGMTAKERAACTFDALAFAVTPAERRGVLERAIIVAVAEEREACAKSVESFATESNGTVSEWGGALAAAIRARSNP